MSPFSLYRAFGPVTNRVEPALSNDRGEVLPTEEMAQRLNESAGSTRARLGESADNQRKQYGGGGGRDARYPQESRWRNAGLRGGGASEGDGEGDE